MDTCAYMANQMDNLIQSGIEMHEFRESRNIFLTEAMAKSKGFICKCEVSGMSCYLHPVHDQITDFSDWEGFGELWNWSKTQEWWADFMSRDVDAVDFYESLIDPDHYADAIYDLLTESIYDLLTESV